MYYPNYYLEAEEFLQGKRNFLRRTTKIRRKTVSRACAHGFGRISDCPLRSYLRHCGRCYCVSRVIQPVYAKTARYSLIVVYSETMPLYLSPTRAASFLVPNGGPLPPLLAVRVLLRRPHSNPERAVLAAVSFEEKEGYTKTLVHVPAKGRFAGLLRPLPVGHGSP